MPKEKINEDPCPGAKAMERVYALTQLILSENTVTSRSPMSGVDIYKSINDKGWHIGVAEATFYQYLRQQSSGKSSEIQVDGEGRNAKYCLKWHPMVVFPLHGIRTQRGWMSKANDVLSPVGWICLLDKWHYGWFWAVQLLMPWARRAKVHWFVDQYGRDIATLDQGPSGTCLPSIVAHSMGSYILGYALLKHEGIRFNKVIVCGSILPRAFPWDKILERGQVQAVRCEYGGRDLWSWVCSFLVQGSGAAGQEGFECKHERFEQEAFPTFDHSDYFFEVHIKDKWIPFLNRVSPLVLPQRKTIDSPRGDRRHAPRVSLCAISLMIITLLWIAGTKFLVLFNDPLKPYPLPAGASTLKDEGSRPISPVDTEQSGIKPHEAHTNGASADLDKSTLEGHLGDNNITKQVPQSEPTVTRNLEDIVVRVNSCLQPPLKVDASATALELVTSLLDRLFKEVNPAFAGSLASGVAEVMPLLSIPEQREKAETICNRLGEPGIGIDMASRVFLCLNYEMRAELHSYWIKGATRVYESIERCDNAQSVAQAARGFSGILSSVVLHDQQEVKKQWRVRIATKVLDMFTREDGSDLEVAYGLFFAIEGYKEVLSSSQRDAVVRSVVGFIANDFSIDSDRLQSIADICFKLSDSKEQFAAAYADLESVAGSRGSHPRVSPEDENKHVKRVVSVFSSVGGTK